MIFSISPTQPNKGLTITTNGVNYADFNNFMLFDPRTVVDNATELRLVRFLVGRANREAQEIPGVTKNIDYNVLVELVRVSIHPTANNTPYGNVPVDFGNGGYMGTDPNTQLDPTAQWRQNFQIRRGMRKRWDWNGAIRLGKAPTTGWREALISRVALLRPFSTLITVMSFQMEFATSPEDVPAY